MDKGVKVKLAGSPGENGGGQDAQKDLHSRSGRDETKRKTQERMERRNGKRSSSVGSEKMERVGDRQGQLERYFSTGQSPQPALAPTGEEEYDFYVLLTVHLGIIFVNKQTDAQFFFMCVYFYSLHVSGSHVPIIRRIICIHTTSRICHSVQMTVWCAGLDETADSSKSNNGHVDCNCSSSETELHYDVFCKLLYI